MKSRNCLRESWNSVESLRKQSSGSSIRILADKGAPHHWSPTRSSHSPLGMWVKDFSTTPALEIDIGGLTGGLGPWSCDSGRKRGHGTTLGGRDVVRQALHLCACPVVRVGGGLRRCYQILRQQGEVWQCGLGGGGAHAAIAVERAGPPGNALGAFQRIDKSSGQLAKGLTSSHGYRSDPVLKKVRRPKLGSGLL